MIKDPQIEVPSAVEMIQGSLPPTEALMTTAEAARLLKKSPAALRNWRSVKKGPSYVKYEGGAVRYPRAEVIRWVAANTVILPGR